MSFFIYTNENTFKFVYINIILYIANKFKFQKLVFMRCNFLLLFFSFALVLLCISFYSHAQYDFVKNKGQWHENVLHKVSLNNGAIFLEDNCITYNFFREGDMAFSSAHHDYEFTPPELIKHFHAYKVHFRNSNRNPEVIPDKAFDDYLNFYIGNDPSKWASRVPKYEEIYYKDLYDGIDFKFYQNYEGLKYDFIVRPGYNPNNIVLEYEGIDNIFIENENVKIITSVNEIIEVKPYAYQIINNKKIEVKCNYNLKRNRLSFEFPDSYDKNYELVIDPSLVFSTYTGSTGDNWGFTATWDYEDNVYAGGIVFDVGYPTSTGAYQVSFAGGTPWNPASNWYANGCDVGIIKYNEDGTQRLFATYLGGTGGQEMPHSLVVTESNDLLIMGTTGSPDFPISPNAYRDYFMGGDSVVYDNVIGFHEGTDIFVTKLSEDGSQLLGSTYIGGSSNDGLNFKIHYSYHGWVKQHGNDSLYANYGDGARGEIIVDDLDYVYVGTTTFSNDFSQGINPGFQPNSGGGQEGIVFKMNPDLSQLIWSTYIGGSHDDAVFSIDLNNQYDVLVAGATVSHDFPTTVNAYSPNFNGGNTDAFVSKISKNGNSLLSSTYYGSEEFDNAFFVRTDRFNNVFITGQTKATGSTLIHNAGYSIPNSGQYIAKFNSDMSELEWSTVFGTGNGKPNISISAFDVDICDRIYLAGWGRDWPHSFYNEHGDYYTWDDTFGTKGMEVTPDAIQSETDGMDFYIMVLDEDANELEYATFFGELRYAGCGASGRDHVDGGTSRFDRKGHIIQSVCSSCGGCQEFPTYPDNVWSTSNNASNCNNAVFKIQIIENLALANFDPVPAGCAPYTVQFNNTSQGNVIEWDFGDGTTSTEENPEHTYTSGGAFTVTLIVNDPMSCNINDTLSRVITVMDPDDPTYLPDIEICPGEQVVIGPTTNFPPETTFSWIQGGNLNNYSIKNPVANPSGTTNYILIAEEICVDTIYQTVLIYEPDVDITVPDDMIICEGDEVTLTAGTTSQVDSWEWSDSPTFNNILSQSQSFTVSPTSSGTYYVRATENICNLFVVEQVSVFIHEFNYDISTDVIICEDDNTNITIVNNNPADELSYLWSPSEFIQSGENTNSPLVAPESNTTFYVTITNQIGCVTTDTVKVEINYLMFATPVLTHNPCYNDCKGSAVVSAEGIPPYEYFWSNEEYGGGITGLCVGTYDVTVIDNLGCTAHTSVEITEPPELTGEFTSIKDPECDGIGYGAATITAYGGTPGYTYQWSYGGNEQTNNTLLVGTNYVTITDNNNCKLVEIIEMEAPGDLISSIADYEMITCYGYCDGSIAVTASYGPEPYSYYWSNQESTPEIDNLCAGQYIVTIIDAIDCVSHQQMWITQPDTLIAQATAIQEILCYNELGSIGVYVTGGTPEYSYNWDTGEQNVSLTDVEAGIYNVTVIDNNGCVDSSEIYLSQPPELLIDTLVNNMICDNVCNGYINIETYGGTSPYYYNWSSNNYGPIASNLCKGDYSLTLTDNNGCEYIEHFYIENLKYIPPLKAETNKIEIYVGEEVNLNAIAPTANSYTWYPSASLNNNKIKNPIATPDQTTLYEVIIYDSLGCKNIDTVRVFVKEVICGDPFIFVPNAFTPNGDGINDYFMVKFPPTLVTDLYFAVYNRWGEILFETNDINSIGWDGTYNGQELGMDVFVFMLEAWCLDGQKYEEKGNVTLIR